METVFYPQHSYKLDYGFGMAVCASLRRLVTSSSDNTLSLFEICPDGTFAWLSAIGSTGDGPLQFAFYDGYESGYMCFTAGTRRPTLLVTEARNNRVQELDVLAPAHVGFCVVDNPRGVAASASLIAVSAFKKRDEGDHVVHVFDASTRAALYVIGHGCGTRVGQLHCPHGLRLSIDGTVIAVADCCNHRVSVFCTSDGAFAGHISNAVENPVDVEECEDAKGWVVARGASDRVAFVGGSGLVDGKFSCPSALALVCGVGLVVREAFNGGRVQVFSTPAVRRMHALSPTAVAWLGCVVRAGWRLATKTRAYEKK